MSKKDPTNSKRKLRYIHSADEKGISRVTLMIPTKYRERAHVIAKKIRMKWLVDKKTVDTVDDLR